MRQLDRPRTNLVTSGGLVNSIIGHGDLLPLGRMVYRMVMPQTVPSWTVEMVDALPDDGQRHELIDGELFVTPSPGEFHQDVVLRLLFRLGPYLDTNRHGKLVVSPSDVRRGDYSRNRVQPDVFVIRMVNGERPTYPYELSHLLLAIEVASPGNALYDYQTKRALYLREGVEQYWVVNPEARNVSVWRGRDEPGEVLSNEVQWLPAGATQPLVIQLPEFFEEALR